MRSSKILSLPKFSVYLFANSKQYLFYKTNSQKPYQDVIHLSARKFNPKLIITLYPIHATKRALVNFLYLFICEN